MPDLDAPPPVRLFRRPDAFLVAHPCPERDMYVLGWGDALCAMWRRYQEAVNVDAQCACASCLREMLEDLWMGDDDGRP